MENDCLFCKIVSKKIPAAIEYEDERIMAFRDIKPQAKIHILVIPKKHLPTLKDLEGEDEQTMGHIMKKISELAKKFELNDYKIQINVGKKGGQVVFHLHMHLMSVE